MTDEINTNEAVGDAQAEVPNEPVEPAQIEPAPTQPEVAEPKPVLNLVEIAEPVQTAQMEGNEPLAGESGQGEDGLPEVRQQADFGEAKEAKSTFAESSDEAMAEPATVLETPTQDPKPPAPSPEPQTAQIPRIEPLDSALAGPVEPLEAVPPTAIPTAPVVAQPTRNFIGELLAKARIAIQGRKRKKLDRIMALFEKRSSITNDEVEKLLHISDATATRYLNILEQEGRIKQFGKAGKFVFYTKI